MFHTISSKPARGKRKDFHAPRETKGASHRHGAVLATLEELQQPADCALL